MPFLFLDALNDQVWTFISYKSGTVQEEATEAEKAIKILGGQLRDITYFQLPDSEIDRSLVIIDKKKPTPGKYPRKAGTPLKEPLSHTKITKRPECKNRRMAERKRTLSYFEYKNAKTS